MIKDCVKNKVKSEPADKELSGLEDYSNAQGIEKVLSRDCHICQRQFMKRRNMLEHFISFHVIIVIRSSYGNVILRIT